MPTTPDLTRLLELAAAATPLPWEDGGIDADFGPAIRQPGRGDLLTRALPIDDPAYHVLNSRDDPAEPKRPDPAAVADLLHRLRHAAAAGPFDRDLLTEAADALAHLNALCPLDCPQEIHFGRTADGHPDIADRDYMLAAANLAPEMARELLARRPHYTAATAGPPPLTLETIETHIAEFRKDTPCPAPSATS